MLLKDGRWGIPRGSTPTTHILKPPIPGFPGHCENEHLCLALARALGLPAARSRVARFGDETAIVVERYDRITTPARLARVHQEDLCQTLGIPPTRKYQSDGGPGCGQIIDAIRTHSGRPGRDARTFARAIALNWIIGGTDAHAKNFSMLIGPSRHASLAPLYDMASLLPYPSHYAPRLKMATKIGGEARLGYIRARHWERFAKEAGLARGEVLNMCRSLAAEVPDRFRSVIAAARSQGLDHPVVPALEDAVLARAGTCLASLDA